MCFVYEVVCWFNCCKVMVVYKVNIMKFMFGLFLDVVCFIVKEYDDIEYEEMIVDNCVMQLVMNLYCFDVIVIINLFGDIFFDLCVGFIGGLGLVFGVNVGEYKGIFEVVYGSVLDIVGQNIVNFIVLMLGVVMMLEYLECNDDVERMCKVICFVVGEGQVIILDLGGKVFIFEFIDEVICNFQVFFVVFY